eukprot:217132-Pelagomonas_calceolata.AAC.2
MQQRSSASANVRASSTIGACILCNGVKTQRSAAGGACKAAAAARALALSASHSNHIHCASKLPPVIPYPSRNPTSKVQ